MSLELSKKAKSVKQSSTLAITAKAKEMKNSGIDVVGFGAGEPDFDTPENIRNAGKKAIDDGFTRYTPASGTAELKKAVSAKFAEFNHLHYDPDQIVISNGGKHSLTNIFQAITNPGDEVIIPVPYWLTYPELVKMCDGIPVFLETKKENGFKIDIEDLKALVSPATKALILNTPCNPTGMIYSREELQAIADLAVEKDFYIIADEMYEYLTYCGKEHVSIASLGEEIYKRTITCSGVSKAYAMTGWRIGYTGSSKEIAKIMSSIQSHETSNPNSIAQKAAVEALTGPQDAIEMMRQAFDERRQYMKKRIDGLPLVSALEPDGAFYCFIDCSGLYGKEYRGAKIESAADAAAILLEEFHVAVVPCADFGCPTYIRLSYATSMDMIEKGMDRIESFISEL